MPNLVRFEPMEERELAVGTLERISEVTSQLKTLKSNMVQNALQMGELLLEAKHNNYHVIAGHDQSSKGWEAWLQSSGLDISISQSYYLMKIVDKSNYLSIPKDTLAECNMASLKEIFALDPVTQGDMIKELVEGARNAPMSATKDKVDKIRIDNGEEIFQLKAFRLRQDVVQNVIDKAIDNCRLEYGQIIDSESNEVIEISEGRALELICIEFNNSR